MQSYGTARPNTGPTHPALFIPFYGLPIDLWILILNQLSIQDLGALAQVAKRMNIIADNNSFWKIKAKHDLLAFTNEKIIDKTYCDDVAGIRKKYYRNTLFRNNVLPLKEPQQPTPPSKPDYFDSYGFPVSIACSAPFTLSFVAIIGACIGVGCCCPHCCSPLTIFAYPVAAGGGLGCLMNIFMQAGTAREALQTHWEYKERVQTYEVDMKRYIRLQKLHTTMMQQDTTYFYPKKQRSTPQLEVEDKIAVIPQPTMRIS